MLAVLRIRWPQKMKSWYLHVCRKIFPACSEMATVKEIVGLETLSSLLSIVYFMDVIPQHSLGGRGKYGGA